MNKHEDKLPVKTDLSASKLNYVIQRKYKNIIHGEHYIVGATTTEGKNGVILQNNDASIFEWNLDDIEPPTYEEIVRIWKEVEDEYWGDPEIIDDEEDNEARSNIEVNITEI